MSHPALRSAGSFDGHLLRVIRSDRKSVSLEILSDLTLLVRAPRRMRQCDIDALLFEKAAWIAKGRETVLARRRACADQPPPFTKAELADLKKEARRLLPARVEALAAQMGVPYGRVTVRAQRTRFGSCSAAGNISLNCLLVCFPPPVQDYVILHELCHLKHMNHSPAFWRAVATVCPDYQTHRAYLRDEGSRIAHRLCEMPSDSE